MQLKDYVRVLLAHWLGVLGIVALCLGATAAYTLTRTEVYAANANGFVTSGTPATDPALGSVGDSLAKSRAKSYVDIAKSRATAALVIDDLGLDVEPASLIGSISVEQPPDTVLIKITARAASPQDAQELADAWVSALAVQVEAVENPDGKGTAATRVRSVESAELPSSPVSPRPTQNLAIGLAAGLLLGLAYALVRNQLDRRLRDATEVERAFNVPVVGFIPETADLKHKDGDVVPIAVDGSPFDEPSSSAEAFRKLRTNLSYMDVDHPPRVIIITSPSQSDGKSTLAANLAAAIAVGGQPVTLLDADLRRPTVARSFGLVEGAGLTDILSGRASAQDVMQSHARLRSLNILAAGEVPPNPSELLGSQAMRTLLGSLASEGIVIVDAPPLLPVTDAAVLGGSADGVLVVINSGSTLDSDLRVALDNLQAVHAKVLGIVFNRVTGRGNGGAYYGNYYQAAQTKPKAKAKAKPQARAKDHRSARRRKDRQDVSAG